MIKGLRRSNGGFVTNGYWLLAKRRNKIRTYGLRGHAGRRCCMRHDPPHRRQQETRLYRKRARRQNRSLLLEEQEAYR